jgi:hypothetical protein
VQEVEMRHAKRTPLAALLAAAVTSCGGPQPQPPAAPAAPLHARAPYAPACRALGRDRAEQLAARRYHPPELLVHAWPSDPPAAGAPPTDAVPAAAAQPSAHPDRISEEALAGRLAEGRSRVALLIARGGTGKSRLAWSLEAALCARLPLARVDLQWDVAAPERALPAGQNPVLAAAVRKLGGDEANAEAWLRDQIGDGRWLLLLDSLDEVALQERVRLADAVNGALDAFAGLRVVVLTRPPVFTGNYGLRGVDGRVELPQLDCARTDAAIAQLVPDAAKRQALLAFATRYGLDRKATTPDGRCYYPHLSTYRDFFVIRRIAESFAQAGAAQADQLEPSRARIYGFFLEVSLIKDLQGLALTPRAAIELVDRAVASGKAGDGDRNQFFDVDRCVALLGGSPAPKGPGRAICERLLQSSLFEAAPGGEGRFRLRNQSLYDYFLARQADAEVRAPAGGCAALERRAALFESNEVAGFLVGMAGGQRCLVGVVHQLCRAGGFAQHNFEQLDQGLPAGAARKALVDAALAQVRASGAPAICVTATLERLYTVAQAPADPGQTPPPPPPGARR